MALMNECGTFCLVMVVTTELSDRKELCLPVLRLLEPRLAPGALVAADDNDHSNVADYLKYVREPANGYVSVSFPVADGVEISSWTGRW
jgi:predicted O-methyltransferase YrrM